MKRFRGSSFFAGAVSTFLVLSIGVTFANASELFSGKTLYNQTGIAVFGTETIKKGEAFRAPNGQDVPSVITYVDETGGKTNYLSIRQISELLDAEISWNAKTGNVDIAPAGDGSVTVSRGERPGVASIPEYGIKAGPFTEIDPSTMTTDGKNALIQLPDSHQTSTTGCYTQAEFRANGGSLIVFTVTNNGEYAQAVRVSRPITISSRPCEAFSTVRLEPGQTLTRTFTMDTSASRLQSKLDFDVDGIETGNPTDVTMSICQYK